MTKPVKPTRHGLNAVKNRVEIRGFRVVDRRSAVAKALFGWKAALLRDLGGEENVSAQKRALVDLAVRTRLYVDHCDAFLMEQPSLILKRRKTVLPILLQRQSLADSLARMLSMLGLDRVSFSPPPFSRLHEQSQAEIQKLMEEDDDEHEKSVEGSGAS